MTGDLTSSDADWDPGAPDVLADQRAAYDALRARCPVARDATGGFTLLRHEDVRRAALDHDTFSNAVSRFRNVPNSMDGDEHRRFRCLVDRFFDPERLVSLVPVFRQVGEEVVATLRRNAPIDAVQELGLAIAVRAQSRWLGWPTTLERTLRTWVEDHREALRSGSTSRIREPRSASMRSCSRR
jgi:cytochrome P450